MYISIYGFDKVHGVGNCLIKSIQWETVSISFAR